MIKKLVLVLLAMSLLSADAANITLSEPLKLSPSSSSKTVSLSLDQVPSNLIKRGQIRDANIKLKFKLNKEGKRSFSLDPKNGKVVVQIKDGVISPGQLTITAAQDTELKEFPYSIKFPRAFKKTIEKHSGNIEFNNVRTIRGRVDLSNVGPNVKTRVKNLQASGSTLEIFRFDPISKQTTETLSTTTVGADGSFVADIPTDIDFGGDVLCQTSTNDANQSVIRAFIVDDEPVISPESEFITSQLIAPNSDLDNLSASDIASLITLARNQNLSAQTFEEFNAQLNTTIGDSVTNFINNPTNGNIELPASFDGLNIEFRLGKAGIGAKDGQPIFGQAFAVIANRHTRSVPADQNTVFPMTFNNVESTNLNSIFATDGSGEGNQMFMLNQVSNDLAPLFNPKVGTTNKKNNCLTLNFSKDTVVDGDFQSVTDAAVADAAYSTNTQVILGNTGSPSVTDTVGGETVAEFTKLGIQFGAANTDPSAPKPSKQLNNNSRFFIQSIEGLKLLSTSLLGMTAMVITINTDSNQNFSKFVNESAVADCAAKAAISNNLAELNCDGKKAKVEAEQLPFATDYTINGSFFNSTIDEFELKTPEKKEQGDAVDLLLTPILGDNKDSILSSATTAGRTREIMLTQDVTGSFKTDLDDERARVDLIFLYALEAANASLNDEPFKVFGYMFGADSGSLEQTGVTGNYRITRLPGDDIAYNVFVEDEIFSKQNSSLQTPNPNNLKPTQSTDTINNVTVTATASEGEKFFTMDSIHGTKRRCHFNSDFFFCQVESSNINDGSSNAVKSAGIIYGVKVED